MYWVIADAVEGGPGVDPRVDHRGISLTQSPVGVSHDEPGHVQVVGDEKPPHERWDPRSGDVNGHDLDAEGCQFTQHPLRDSAVYRRPVEPGFLHVDPETPAGEDNWNELGVADGAERVARVVPVQRHRDDVRAVRTVTHPPSGLDEPETTDVVFAVSLTVS